MIATCYAAWLIIGASYVVIGWPAIFALAVVIALHSSLQHEAIHGHPTTSAGWNEALVSLPIGLFLPYRRYRELHLLHHGDSRLTDPFDDPESFYTSHEDYDRLPRIVQYLFGLNNTLPGRMLLGPAISTVRFAMSEFSPAPGALGCTLASRRNGWMLHALGLIPTALIVHFGFGIPIYAYIASAYMGLSLLALRSFCEHQWADEANNRTVIVDESRISWLFLNNNLHLVHHAQPGTAWYALPAAYQERQGDWTAMNNGYVFHGYRAVIGKFGWRQKEPVVHPAAEHTSVAKATHSAS
jgi:fatty acid desaturase